MKYLTLLTALFAITSFTRVGRPAPAADAVYSYNLQGTKVSGGEVDAVKINNIARVSGSAEVKKVQFFLSDGLDENAGTYAHSLRFAVPNKAGSYVLNAEHDDGHVELFVAAKGADNYTVYSNDVFNVTISSISATRVSGAFSGKLKPISGSGEMSITDGKFDIPVFSLTR
ncbi:MAG TPA: hypothetical protein VGM89_16575 [Puia sp.]|jgi:hypothetical protein